MTFVACVKYWNEYINNYVGGMETVHCFLVAETFKDAMDYVCRLYGEECIEAVSLEAFGPDQMLEFNEDNVEEYAMFNEIYNQLAPKQVW